MQKKLTTNLNHLKLQKWNSRLFHFSIIFKKKPFLGCFFVVIVVWSKPNIQKLRILEKISKIKYKKHLHLNINK